MHVKVEGIKEVRVKVSENVKQDTIKNFERFYYKKVSKNLRERLGIIDLL